MNIIAKWTKMREDLRKFFSVTPIDIAKNHGLTVELVSALPARLDGFLDPHDRPHYIAVNSQLHQVEQSYAICREVSRFRQELRLNSIVLNSAQRWKIFDQAPENIKTRIRDLDLEHRALMMLAFWGKGGEYAAYHKRNPSKIFRTGFIALTTDFWFFLLRILAICHWLCRHFSVAEP